eukprot:CAMPEP_0181022952 /NCGR_PEP_ID=MMETSP1070-20121207/1785_1 /TAXON_ID=265543 /ORGANISM="Minutocellus polymorphus, Strain NH13" /LENGTH=490 /DNA_ID=CAMNT_0023099921 /DNA_START=324 /DNA_END=1792 /DNA_ORIENTATION=+
MSVSGDGSPDDLRGCVESELGLLVVEAKKNGLCQAEVAVEAAQRLGICDYELARELRVDIGRAFSAEKDKFRGFIPCEDISDDAALGQYAKDIAETNEWGDHIQLHITQSLLKRPLEIYNVRSRTVTYIRGPGDERTEPFPSGPVVHGGAEEDRPIRFIYNGVDHFDAVRRQLAVVTASDGAGQESEVERAVDVRRIHAPWPSLHQTVAPGDRDTEIYQGTLLSSRLVGTYRECGAAALLGNPYQRKKKDDSTPEQPAPAPTRPFLSRIAKGVARKASRCTKGIKSITTRLLRILKHKASRCAKSVRLPSKSVRLPSTSTARRRREENMPPPRPIFQADCNFGIFTNEMLLCIHDGHVPESKSSTFSAEQLQLMQDAIRSECDAIESEYERTECGPLHEEYTLMPAASAAEEELHENEMLDRHLELVKIATMARSSGLSVEQTHELFGLLADTMSSDRTEDVDDGRTEGMINGASDSTVELWYKLATGEK